MAPPSLDDFRMDRVLQALWDQHTEATIEVHNSRGRLDQPITKEKLAAIITTDKPHLAISVPNIPHLTGEPSVTNTVGRLQLIEMLIASTPRSIYFDPNTTKFSFLVSKGCFIPPQLNPLSGTWFRCLTEDDWLALRTDPVKWQRSGDGLQKFTHIPIGPGQAFMTPVANPSVMVFYFPKASYVECGIYWDCYAMREILQWMQKAYGHPAAAKFKQPSPEQLLAILEEFQIMINAHQAAFTQTCTLPELQTELQGAVKKVREKVVGERELQGELETMSERVDDERRDSAST
ncbi:hypothetical protein LTR97_004508 [Elasticomyces elasticus]|uniref:Uncharacterized protein n=1 Tax=Elasticomyces elasticus TaxID=574655 RepID=A0AAN7W8M3_9PEZI|nr:hypothetical protein LTR97_004508 [Elasticomyces elasticus]